MTTERPDSDLGRLSPGQGLGVKGQGQQGRMVPQRWGERGGGGGSRIQY